MKYTFKHNFLEKKGRSSEDSYGTVDVIQHIEEPITLTRRARTPRAFLSDLRYSEEMKEERERSLIYSIIEELIESNLFEIRYSDIMTDGETEISVRLRVLPPREVLSSIDDLRDYMNRQYTGINYGQR